MDKETANQVLNSTYWQKFAPKQEQKPPIFTEDDIKRAKEMFGDLEDSPFGDILKGFGK